MWRYDPLIPFKSQGVASRQQGCAPLAVGVRIEAYPVEIVEMEESALMRFRTALSMATFFLTCFTIAVWSTPLNAQAHVKTNSAAELQSVSGKIASVGAAEFSLAIRENQRESKLEFLVDGNTKVEGKLSVGAQATVEYRSDAGKNIATHVSVIPASRVDSH